MGNATDEADGIGTRKVVDGITVIIGRTGTIAIGPLSGLAVLPRDEIDAVAADTTEVGKIDEETTTVNNDSGIESGYRVAGATIGADDELTAGIIKFRHFAEVSDILAGHGDALLGADCGSRLRGVPAVVEAFGSAERIAVDIAARDGVHVLAHTFQREVSVAVMRTLIAVVGGQSEVDMLTGMAAKVHTYSSPILPQHTVVGSVPSEVLVSDKVSAGTCGVNDVIVGIKQLHAETRLVGRIVQGVLQHGCIAQQ